MRLTSPPEVMWWLRTGSRTASGLRTPPKSPSWRGAEVDTVVGKHDARLLQIARKDHDPPGQNADTAFEDARVYVQNEAFYTLATQKRGGEGDERRIVRAQELPHAGSEAQGGPRVETERMVSLDHVTNTPPERLADRLAGDLDAVGALIRARMASEHAPRIPQVTAHLVEAGGKRLRPMLTIAAARACGYEGGHHIHLATAVEFIHTATLLHDDVVDESLQRRGRPTANLLWDNKSSVLVGDYLFARSFQLMVETGNLRVLDILADASATIAEGEVLQLSASRNLETGEETYIRIVRGKTAALFSAATRAGAVLAGVERAVEDAYFAYGDALGIAFQIADDLLDYAGSDAIGKNRGDDLREGKLTLPVIRAIARADAGERAFWQRTLVRGEVEDADVAEAQGLLARHGALESTRKTALDWAAQARAALAQAPGGELRDILSDLTDHVVSRLN